MKNKNKKNTIKDLSQDELKKEYERLMHEIVRAKLEAVVNRPKDTMNIVKKKKRLARIIHARSLHTS